MAAGDCQCPAGLVWPDAPWARVRCELRADHGGHHSDGRGEWHDDNPHYVPDLALIRSDVHR